MMQNRSAPRATVVPILVYADVAQALEFLMRAIGFRERLRAEHGGSISHVQMDIGECAIMIGKQSGPFRAPHAAGGNTRGMEAASMVIVKKGAGVSLNNGTVLRFQVDDQEHPYMELRRVVENWNKRRPSPVRPKQ